RSGHPCQLVSLVEHTSASVVAQEQVSRKRDERSAVPALLALRDLHGRVITLVALHTLKPPARLILAAGGDYLMVVKKNQRTLYHFLEMLFRLPAHPADHEVWDQVGPRSEKGHGRLETRTLISGNAHIEDVDWPGVAQVMRRECERIELKSGKVLTGLVKDDGKFLRVLSLDREERIAREEVESRATTKVSVMPDGQEATLSRREFVDLILYLQTLK
ncbi:MAG TPA: ISAs1 family transposase, partial [Gemmataceae bacterium]|nr:ISAs1 family transposase [Gemmataceae bacterium]